MSFHGAVLTVGWVIDAEDHEASRFPNGIRYAQPSEIKDYPPAAVVTAAYRLLEWAREHWDDITWSPTQ
jgi:hypothetical protein